MTAPAPDGRYWLDELATAVKALTELDGLHRQERDQARRRRDHAVDMAKQAGAPVEAIAYFGTEGAS